MANMIFLALSLLPSSKHCLRTSELDSSMFFPPSEGEDDGIIYIGQTDPIVIWKANQYREEDLYVIALCTKQVLCDSFSSEEPVTSAQFFMQNVCDGTDRTADLTSYRKEFCRQEFCSADGKIKFLLLPVNEDDLNPGIRDSVDAIREWNKTRVTGEEKFWVDVHGGFRNTMTVLSGIITLLKIDGIVPEKVYAPRYDFPSKTMTLPKSAEEIEIFDFVSGMDDFINYGNADQLIGYFDRHKVSEYERMVLSAIEKVATGTQCCDTILYKQGLTELSELLNKSVPKDSFLLGLFLNYIRDSYGELLSKRRTTLMIVRRCVEKKLYQQALTFIEASMPQEIVKKGLLTFDISNYQLQEVQIHAKESGANYYLFHAFLKMGNIVPMIKKKSLKYSAGYYAEHEKELKKALTGIIPVLPEIDTCVNTGNRNNDLPVDIKDTNFSWEFPGMLKGVDSRVPINDRGVLGIFLRLHMLVKKCRNSYNHSLADRPELNELIILFHLYLDYADYLYKKCK